MFAAAPRRIFNQEGPAGGLLVGFGWARIKKNAKKFSAAAPRRIINHEGPASGLLMGFGGLLVGFGWARIKNTQNFVRGCAAKNI